ncbi:VanZ family protein [Psychroserpens mesophilus]|uniref:VanZ family protein n=1 Tax=Psychroserpens mesophilus TaxID=325473 RepID=UPI003D64F75B
MYVATLTFASLGNVSGVPKIGFSFDDKIYHFLAYAILTFLLHNYFTITTVKRKVLLSVVIAVIYGIIIEVLQSIVTDFRTPDYHDVLANTAGALFLILLLRFKNKLKLK